MRKLLLSFAFLLTAIAFIGTAYGGHVRPGKEIGAFLICKTPESALATMALLVAVKKEDPASGQAYRDYVLDEDVPCIDMRSIGISQVTVTPVKRMPKYRLSNDRGVFTLWEVEVNGMTRYTWEGDRTSET